MVSMCACGRFHGVRAHFLITILLACPVLSRLWITSGRNAALGPRPGRVLHDSWTRTPDRQARRNPLRRCTGLGATGTATSIVVYRTLDVQPRRLGEAGARVSEGRSR